MPLVYHYVDLDDAVLDPFPRDEDFFNYLGAANLKTRRAATTPDASNVLNFEVEMYLDGNCAVMSRTRYTYWELLGDVGGFNDGLMLICTFFMATYSALSYNINVLNGTVVDT